MKKLFIILGVLTIVSCKKAPNNERTLIITVDEYNRLKDGTAVQYPKPFEFIDYEDLIGNGKSGIVSGSDGHEYIVNKKGFDRESIIHSPECPKCKEVKHNDLLTIINELRKDSIK